MSNVKSEGSRIHSVDQFRGYSVAAMFVVNFLGGLAVTHQVLRHNNTHFSYADSIMPSFIFVCGLSYRMSFLNRLGDTKSSPSGRVIARSLSLIVLSLMLAGFNSRLVSWSEMSGQRVIRFVGELLKADLWEVLAIIGALQILLLPWIAKAAWVRIAAFCIFGLAHFCISLSFNYDFVYGRPNWMDEFFGATGKLAWDGGLFGLLAWSQIMLAGTLAFDLMKNFRQPSTAGLAIAFGTFLMLSGYCMSCLTTLYDLQELSEAQSQKVVSSPVIPDFSAARGKSWKTILAEPPFFAPPPPTQRALNYWMMDKRVVTQSFVWFSTGFALAMFGVFVVACDVHHVGLGIFEMFGKNPLAAYIINHFVNHSILALVPKDSPLVWSLMGLVAAFGITYWFVRFLDSRKLYLRL